MIVNKTDIPSANAQALMSKPRNERRPLHVGARLRDAREQAGMSLDEVAQKIRIRESHLMALEQFDLGGLPGRAYAIGFLRAYADYLNLDADECVKRFKVEVAARGPEQSDQRFDFPQPSVKRGPLPGSSIVLVAIVLFLGVWGGWQLTRPAPDQLFDLASEELALSIGEDDADVLGDSGFSGAEGALPPGLAGDPTARRASVAGGGDADLKLARALADLAERPIPSAVAAALQSDEAPIAATTTGLSSAAAPEAPAKVEPEAAPVNAAPEPAAAAPVADPAEPTPQPEADRSRENAAAARRAVAAPSQEDAEIAQAIAAGLAALEAERAAAKRAEAERLVAERERQAAAAQGASEAALASAGPDAPVEAAATADPAPVEAESGDVSAPETTTAAPPLEPSVLTQPERDAAPAPASPTSDGESVSSPQQISAAPEASSVSRGVTPPAAIAAAAPPAPTSLPAQPEAPAAPIENAATTAAGAVTTPTATTTPTTVTSGPQPRTAAASAETLTEKRPAPTLPKGETRGSAEGSAVAIRAVIPGYMRVISSAGVVLVNKQVKTGDVFYAPSDATLTVYNAAGFDVIVEGDYRGPLGAPGERLDNLSLNPSSVASALASN